MNPFAALLKSRKFLLLILDVVVSLVTHFVTKYAGGSGEDALLVIGALQPVFVAVIGAIAYEDNGERRLTAEMAWREQLADEETGAAGDA